MGAAAGSALVLISVLLLVPDDELEMVLSIGQTLESIIGFVDEVGDKDDDEGVDATSGASIEAEVEVEPCKAELGP